MGKSRRKLTRQGAGIQAHRLFAGIRQWTYAKEFRIASAVWPPGVVELLRELRQRAESPSEPGSPQPGREALPRRLLADVGTGLWRLRQRMVEPGSDRPLDEMRRAFRHLESITDALAQAGVEIRGHTDEPLPEQGVYALKVIAFQPTPGLARDQVLETIKPSIYCQGELIQMGEVIVGTPEPPAGEAASDDNRHETGEGNAYKGLAGRAGYGPEHGGEAHGQGNH